MYYIILNVVILEEPEELKNPETQDISSASPAVFLINKNKW